MFEQFIQTSPLVFLLIVIVGCLIVGALITAWVKFDDHRFWRRFRREREEKKRFIQKLKDETAKRS